MEASTEEHWEQTAQELSTFYKKERSVLRRAVEKIFNKGQAERIELTLRNCKNVRGKKILDIGFGLGQASGELIKREAEVIGISSAPNKSTFAMSKHEIEGIYVVICDPFFNHVFDEDFDISIALGLFDYVQNPLPYLKKMKLLTREKCIMSFSSKFAFQVPIRILWPRSRKCPVYFYTKKEIKRLLSPIFFRFKIKNISAGYHCVASV